MRKNRTINQLRDIEIIPNFSPNAEGSCFIKFGDTHVLCNATIDYNLPRWLKGKNQGWISAEYGMLPRSTQERMSRESKLGKQSGRTQEIQRLIGRSLRSVVDLSILKDIQILIDCDVIQADGGTRTASITGSFIAISIFTDTITIYHLIIVSFFQGTFWAFMMPARQAIIAELVDDNQLNNAISLNAAGMSLTTMISPAIGGLVYHYFGPGMTYVLITFFCIIAIISTSMIPSTKSKNNKKPAMFREIKDVLSLLKNNSLLMYLILLALVTTLLTMPTRTLFAPYASENLSGGALQVGLMLASIGGGALLGTLIAASIPQNSKKGKYILITSIISGFSILILGFSSITIFSIFICFFLGLGDAGRRSLNPSLIILSTQGGCFPV